MTRLGFAALGLTALALAGTIRLELAAGDGAPLLVAAERPAIPRPGAAPAAGALAGQQQEWVATALARPLFSQSRRPAARTAKGAAVVADGELPRLTGVIVSGGHRSAIFQPGTGKPVVLGEGAQIGRYTVQSIGLDQVTLIGPHDRQSLHPAFERKPEPPRVPVFGVPNPPRPAAPSAANMTMTASGADDDPPASTEGNAN